MTWTDKINQVWQGDCLELMKEMPDKCVDLVLTDPPYNVNYGYNEYKDTLSSYDYFDWQIEILRECERILKDDGSLFYLNYPEFNSKIYVALEEDFELKPKEIIAWVYPTNLGGKYLRKGFRTWVWASKKEPKNYITGEYLNPTDKRVSKLIADGKKPKSVDWWKINQVKNVSKEKTSHPCQLPIEMIKKIIVGTTKEQEIVFDPFMGSWTTALAVQQTNRNFIGAELSPEYCEIGRNRLKQQVLI